MRIAVVSDTHSQLKNTELALRIIEREGVDTVLHCGDICDAATVRSLAGRDVHFVLGNNDWDKKGLYSACEEIGVRLHGQFADLQLAGKRIAMLHGDDFRLLESTSQGGEFDYVFFGHSHEVERNQVGRTHVLNPGALYRARPKTFALVDLSSGEVEVVKVAD